MLGLTIIELLFYENHRSVWVVVIGLELLTLAYPGLGLGSDYGYIIYASVTHVIVMVILILLVWRIDFRVTGLELIGVMLAVRGFSPVRCWKPVVSYHTQIEGPVHGAITHENSTTMSLYGYGPAWFVVESSFGIPTGCAGKLQWQNHWDVL
jgi:hypothetical protein